MKKSMAILGGDLRQIYLAELLREDGWKVDAWGLEKGGAAVVPLDKAAAADILILPLPLCRGEKLNLPMTDTELSPKDLWLKLRRHQLLLGGNIASHGAEAQELRGLTLLDYFDRETVQIANAVPTAEGAIMRLMEETHTTVQGSRCLVMGYGRIGKALAHRLKLLGADVTVAARGSGDMAWIKACGLRAVSSGECCVGLRFYDAIFNTVPAPVLPEDAYSRIRPDCLLMELASPPGGFCKNAVKDIGLRLLVERGLPGRIAPMTAAKVIREGIYEVLGERGVLL